MWGISLLAHVYSPKEGCRVHYMDVNFEKQNVNNCALFLCEEQGHGCCPPVSVQAFKFKGWKGKALPFLFYKLRFQTHVQVCFLFLDEFKPKAPNQGHR